MMQNFLDKDTRRAEKFYNRVRQDLKESNKSGRNVEESEDEPVIIQKLEKNYEFKDVDEDLLYGKITKEEFSKILSSYDSQQASQDKNKSSVKCDKVTGGSYEKLLLSKQGFHHTMSTDYLIKKLDLKDIGRNSFLGGLSSYDLIEGEDLSALTKYQNRKQIKELLKTAWTHLNNGDYHLAWQQLESAIELDPNNGDTLACRARYHSLKKNYSLAIDDFQNCLKSDPENKNQVYVHLSDCVYQQGMSYFHRADFAKAKQFLESALKYNPENQGALLHRNLCEANINKATPFGDKSLIYRK